MREINQEVQDLSQAGVTVEPFFIQGSEESFDMSKFYSVSR